MGLVVKQYKITNRKRMQVGSWFLSLFPAKATQREVAKQLGISQAAVHQTETKAAYTILIRLKAWIREERFKATL